MPEDTVTLVKDAIHNPSEPRHFMKLKPVSGTVRVRRGEQVLAESRNALRALEVGYDLYDPVLYLPKSDVTATLQKIEKQTHCPLKGDASYYNLTGPNGQVAADEIAWSYDSPFGFADELAGRIAFYANKVTVEITPE